MIRRLLLPVVIGAGLFMAFMVPSDAQAAITTSGHPAASSSSGVVPARPNPTHLAQVFAGPPPPGTWILYTESDCWHVAGHNIWTAETTINGGQVAANSGGCGPHASFDLYYLSGSTNTYCIKFLSNNGYANNNSGNALTDDGSGCGFAETIYLGCTNSETVILSEATNEYVYTDSTANVAEWDDTYIGGSETHIDGSYDYLCSGNNP